MTEQAPPLLLGEFNRTVDERYRLALPGELVEEMLNLQAEAGTANCVLAKERAGCLSLWDASLWERRVNSRINLAKQKLQAGLLENELGKVQLLGRLLSTRHEEVQLAGRSRLLIPRSFRNFLGLDAEAKKREIVVVGAAICVEIWHPTAWLDYVEGRMPKFRKLVDLLS